MYSITTTKWQPCFPGLGLTGYLRVETCGGNLPGGIPLRLKEGLGAGKALKNEGGTQIPNQCKHLLTPTMYKEVELQI